MYTLLFALVLNIWPFASAHPGHLHSRAYHARHLRHLQQARHHRLSKSHGSAHPSLIRR